MRYLTQKPIHPTAAGFVLLLASVVIHAQNTPLRKEFKEFDVASIRENNSSDTGVRMNFPLGAGDAYTPSGGLFRVSNMPLSGYIGFAWKLTPPQSSALSPQLPEWVRVTRYDIEARVEGEPTKDDMRAMMRALLAERFGLKLHTEVREIAVLDMVLAKPGKTGPNLQPHSADDPKCLRNPPPTGFFSPCGIFGAIPGLPAKQAGRNISLTMFADNISTAAGKPVIDKTGMTGTFDFTLVYQPDNADPNSDSTAPGFLRALSDQAGVKLVPAKSPAVFYIFDHIDRPSSN